MKNTLANDRYEDVGFAKLDISREKRTGTAEAIYCAGKTKEQLLKILQTFEENGCSVLGTKCSAEQYEFVRAKMPKACYNEIAKIISVKAGKAAPNASKKSGKNRGTIAVCCAGTADLPVAEEAALTAEFFGAKVMRHYDVGIAGLHRLLSKIEEIRKADVVIAVAGMEGALAGVIAGLVKAPVIAVPTSVGYGASFQGVAPLLTMLNTCAEGVSVVNIDNGFGAAVSAVRMLNIK